MNLEEMKERQERIRNFSIVAHIGHGKSTLADRILKMTDSISKREMKNQVLDDMPLEHERGITIKLNAVALTCYTKDGEDHIFHLIDTPGHVDFSYEVSRSPAAYEDAVLVVDATQGVEAQTLASVFLALDNDLEILPVINKINLPSADPEGTKKQIEDEIGLDTDEIVDISAKTGMGVDEVLEKIIKGVPAPTGDLAAPLEVLIFGSKYDDYRGVVLSVRVVEGMVEKGDRIKLMNGGTEYEVAGVGINSPKPLARDVLTAGDVGYITAAIKDTKGTWVDDTVASADNPTDKPLEGYRQMTPMVYAGLYPTDNAKFNDLRDASEKLQLNDTALAFKPESSQALGSRFYCGFLGLLHMDVIQERLEREFSLDLTTTTPSVTYHAELADRAAKEMENPAEMPDTSSIKATKEPYVRASIMVPNDYVGPIMELRQRKRGDFDTMEYLSDTRVNVIYHIPLSEVVLGFFDKLKSSTRGYASLDYGVGDCRPSNLVKIDILFNGDKVDVLSFIAHHDFATERGREITAKLKKIIPRQDCEIPIQAAMGSKIIARANIEAYRKGITARIHMGNPDRRAKLLDKQKRGKKRMKAVGKVDIPQAVFMTILKTGEQLDEK